MRSTVALLKREFLEHRGAFVYAPAALLGLLTLAILMSLASGHAEFDGSPSMAPNATTIYQIGLAGIFGFWSVYAGLALFFYYADSFSADRRNNALLFWKSMPQSDLKVLGSKAIAGITLFPALIAGFAVLTGLLFYGTILIGAAQVPLFIAPDPGVAISNLVLVTFVGTIYMLLSILWAAPFLAWVAGLSTLFGRWSIPLAFLIPGAVVLLEFLNSLRNGGGRPIADFLAWRLDSIADERAIFGAVVGMDNGGPLRLLSVIVNGVNWTHMGIGVIFAVVIVTLASEYRRRRIEA